MPYKKRHIPDGVRRDVARRHGLEAAGEIRAACHYCGSPGLIVWNPGPKGWVSFPGLHLDHDEPEFRGGDATADNIVLACGPCNRRKGHRHNAASFLALIGGR